MNDPIHYNINIQFNSKENIYECECNSREGKKIKEIIK